MRFNSIINNPGSCRLLATGFDPHRKRPVEFRMVPGEFDIVLINDKTDAWIGPVNSPFLHQVKRLLDSIKAGEDPRPLDLTPTNSATPIKQRRVLLEDPPTEPEPRKRVRHAIEEEDQPQPRRSARHLLT